MKTTYKVWICIERVETRKGGYESYHDEDVPFGSEGEFKTYDDAVAHATKLHAVLPYIEKLEEQLNEFTKG